MSHSVDALILTNKASDAYRVDAVVAEDNTQGLWELRHTPDRVSDHERRQLWAGQIYLQLGSIARTLSRNELPTVGERDNQLRGVYLRAIDGVLPEHNTSLLPELRGYDLGLGDLQIADGSLYVHDFLVAHPDLIAEFVAKDALADKIIARRREQTPNSAPEFFHAGQNGIELLEAAIADLDLIAQTFRRLDTAVPLDS